MRKESANQLQPTERKWETYLLKHALAAGVASGAMISPEIIETLTDGQEENDSDREDKNNKKPPKPPRRPNARVAGRLALGNA